MADNMRTVQLLKLEESFVMMGMESITTATWFKGEPPINYLKQRIGEILVANPWLAGRVVRRDGRVCVKYQDSSPPCEAPYFHLIDASAAGEEGSKSMIEKFRVKTPRDCLDKDEPLFSVTILIRSPSMFALCMSLSHQLGDGYTFYTVYRMLSSDQPVKTLIVERDEAKSKQIEEQLKDTASWWQDPWVLLSMVVGSCLTKSCSLTSRLVNKSWVQAQKTAFLNSCSSCDVNLPGFILTNDILTSAILEAVNCDVGMMAVNFRQRIEGLTNEHVGNYESMICYQRSDYESPALIRSSLQGSSYCRAVTKDEPLMPGLCRRLHAKCALITNWTTFYHALQLQDCEELLHVPLIPNAPLPFPVIVIYMSSPTALAVGIQGAPESLMAQLVASGIMTPEEMNCDRFW